MRPVGFHKSLHTNIKKTIKRVDRGNGWRKVLSCLVCGSKKYVPYITKFNIDIKLCTKCSSLVWPAGTAVAHAPEVPYEPRS